MLDKELFDIITKCANYFIDNLQEVVAFILFGKITPKVILNRSASCVKDCRVNICRFIEELCPYMKKFCTMDPSEESLFKYGCIPDNCNLERKLNDEIMSFAKQVEESSINVIDMFNAQVYGMFVKKLRKYGAFQNLQRVDWYGSRYECSLISLRDVVRTSNARLGYTGPGYDVRKIRLLDFIAEMWTNGYDRRIQPSRFWHLFNFTYTPYISDSFAILDGSLVLINLDDDYSTMDYTPTDSIRVGERDILFDKTSDIGIFLTELNYYGENGTHLRVSYDGDVQINRSIEKGVYYVG